MSFALKHRQIDRQGSFEAWGAGFRYEYDAPRKILDVVTTRDNKPLLFMDLRNGLCDDALLYTQYLEKATQINALVFSGSTTLDLTSTFDHQKLAAIVRSSSVLTHYALDLQLRRFHHFSRKFRRSCSLEEVYIDSLYQEDPETEFFKAFVKTRHGNTVSTGGPSMPGVLSRLSEKVIRDLIAVEFGDNHNHTAHNLLGVSSKLSTTSLILDKDFIPNDKLLFSRPRPEKMKVCD